LPTPPPLILGAVRLADVVHLQVRRKVPATSIEFLAVRVTGRQLAELVVHHSQVEPECPEDPLDRTDRGIDRLAGLDPRHRNAGQPGAQGHIPLAQPCPPACRTDHVGDLQHRMID
jgi:hypothetical protein